MSETNPFSKSELNPSPDPIESIANMTVDEIFEQLHLRVSDASAKILVSKAYEEFKALADRVGENEAKGMVGGLITASIRSKLLAAQGNQSIADRA